MRSDNLQRHMNVHEIKFLDEDDASFNQLDMNVNSRTPTKRKIEEVDEEDLGKLRKSLIQHNDEYNRKIFLGKKVYKILGEGNIQEASLARNMKEALDLYMTNAHDMELDDILVFPQRLTLGHFKEALGVNLVEGGEKELPELKKLRSPL